MKIARTPRRVDRTVPIDGFDMFMLSRCEPPLTLAQLVEIVPCDATETMERIYRLAQLGLVSLLPDSQTSVRPIPESTEDEIDDAVTLRPPAPPWRRRERREDARTDPVKGRARTGFDVDPEPTTGVRARLAAFAPRPRRNAR